MAKFRLTLAAIAIALLTWTGTASAATTGDCGITGASTGTPVTYDPFNPAGLGTTTIALTLTRVNPPGGGFTRSVFFYLRSPTTSANGTEIIPLSVSGNANIYGVGLNIFYDTGIPGPNLLGNPTPPPPSSSNRYLQVDFTGNNAASDSVVVNFSVKLPPNIDVPAGSTLDYNVLFRCTANPNIDQTGEIPAAIQFPVTVLSALQAYFAGPALDFGEVGDKTDADVTTTPIIKTGYVRVASSGVFTVSMTSDNGYKLTFPGGNLANALQTLGYQTTFLGQTRSPTATTAITATCGRAGVPLASGQSLPVTVQLLNGGSTRTPAPTYSDNLVVTLSPVISPTTATSCL